MLLAIHLFIMVIFIALGILFLNGKGAFLIAGYNTMPQNKRDEFDKKKLCGFMGKLMFALAACWLVIALSEILKIMAFLWIGLTLFLAIIIAGVVYANTGKRFKP